MASFIKTETGFPSKDGESVCHCVIYSPAGAAPKAVLQLSHGMCEYFSRYEGFGEFLTKNGFVLAGNDHAGHGKTAPSKDKQGYIPHKNGADIMAGDLREFTGILRRKFPDIPLFLLGHSMGSFALRRYISKYAGDIDGAVIMGTAGPGPGAEAGKLLARLSIFFRGPYYRSVFIDNVAFGPYRKKFGKPETGFDWLSKDRESVKKYVEDENCGYIFTSSAFYVLFDLLSGVSRKKWFVNYPKNLPTLVISGDRDPVGGFGAGTRKVCDRLRLAGASDITLKLCEGDRHEVLNETDREEVYKYILSWLEGRIK